MFGGAEIIDETKIQFIILYAFCSANRVLKHGEIIDIVLNNSNMNFTDFQISLDHLVSVKYLHKTLKDKVDYFTLLEEGREAGLLFTDQVPLKIRQTIDEYIPKFFNEEFKNQRVRTKIEPLNDKEYMAVCSIYDDGNIPLLELKFNAGSQNDAYKIMKRFKNHADEIYGEIFGILTKEEN